MKRYTYVFIALFLLCLLSVPVSFSNGLRSAAVASMAPSWNFLLQSKNLFLKLTTIWPSGGYYAPPEMKKELEMLRLENHNFRYQLELLKAQIDLEKLIGEQAGLLKNYARDDEFAKRRKAEILRRVDLYSQSIIGQVIFRETASWSSSLWINVGDQTNYLLGKTVVAKNSPVVVGTSVVGIIEYVGKNRSRVRLITDGSVVPSVRAIRGDAYLAKGELQGTRQPSWRSRPTVLQGVGFNSDFEDQEGPSRDLRTDKISIVKEGDLLVTTGMDGIFPAGLRLGQVTKIYPLQEGATSYELDAEPLIEDFENLSSVIVLPPIEPIEE